MVIDNSQNPNLTVLYESKKNGAKFYGFLDPLSISTQRGLAAEKAKRFIDMKLTERSLKQLIKEIKKEAGSGDIVKAFAWVQEIEFRLEMITEESSLLDLACIYTMLDEEDPNIPSDTFNRKKHEIFNQDPEAKGFFLAIALSVVKRYSGKREEDLFSYLEDSQAIAERLRRILPEEHLINSINT